MAKILLVEDDNNLREIYGERLMAEGYDIVSASDGEEALQTAVTEKPDLIISDVMMPKISGFDMLDILRQTPETKDVKIIMMTALSQAEDKTRADKLGADKYLVKSQVTLEDVARVVHDLLGDDVEPEETTTPVAEAQATSEQTPVTEPVAPVTPATPMAVTQEPVAVVTPPVAIATPPEPVVAAQPEPQQPIAPQVTPAVPVTEPATSVTPEPAQQVAQAPVVATPPEPVVAAQPEPTMPPAIPPVDQTTQTPQAAATSPAAPVTASAPAPASDPSTISTPTAPVNPISGGGTTPIDTATAQAQTAQAEGSQEELQEVAQQIEQFVASAGTQVQHEEPVHEPSQQDIIHAQNAAEEPEIVSAQPVVPSTNSTVPPVVPVDTGNPEPASSRKKVISPINGDGLSTPDIHALYEQELAKEAANSPVTNPESGQIVAAPPDPTAQNSDGMQNPISTAPELSQELVPPPLETVDATQITGVYASEEEAELAAVNEAIPATNPLQSPVETPVPAPAPAQAQPSNNPSDPNNIAL